MVISKNDKYYPTSLFDLTKVPSKLHIQGDIKILKKPSIAIIGTREASESQLNQAYNIGRLVAKKGYVVLNGLARGCDQEAIRGALSVNGKTIGILPSGLDNIYPSSTKKLVEPMIKNGGCIMTEYEDYIKPQKYTFIERDRLQAAIADKLIVVAAKDNSGTMHTMNFARNLNKQVACIAGNVEIKNIENIIYNEQDLDNFLNMPYFQQLSMAL